MEYTDAGEISACGAGEIMTIVKNHTGTHTIRVMHDDGYESIYSGLNTLYLSEHETVQGGQILGTASGTASFELRKDGVSILPVFSQIQ